MTDSIYLRLRDEFEIAVRLTAEGKTFDIDRAIILATELFNELFNGIDGKIERRDRDVDDLTAIIGRRSLTRCRQPVDDGYCDRYILEHEPCPHCVELHFSTFMGRVNAGDVVAKLWKAKQKGTNIG